MRHAKSSGSSRRSSAVVVRKKRKQAYISNKRLNPVVRALVDRRIHKGEETNEFIHGSVGFLTVTGAVGEDDWKRVLPPILQGDLRDQRSGAKIKLVSIQIKGVVHYVPPNVNDADDALLGRLFICESKQSRIFDTAPRTELSDNLLRDGRDSHDYNGTLDRHFQPTNTPMVRLIKQKFFKMVSNRLQIGGLGTDIHAYTRNIITREFNIKIPCKNKVLRYETGSAYPVNWQPLIAMGNCSLNDPSAGSSETNQLYYQITVRWKNM